MKCPCDSCITRAVCISKNYRDIIGCVLVRDYLSIARTGNIHTPKLEVVCKSMHLKLVKRKKNSYRSGDTYYIEE